MSITVDGETGKMLSLVKWFKFCYSISIFLFFISFIILTKYRNIFEESLNILISKVPITWVLYITMIPIIISILLDLFFIFYIFPGMDMETFEEFQGYTRVNNPWIIKVLKKFHIGKKRSG